MPPAAGVPLQIPIREAAARQTFPDRPALPGMRPFAKCSLNPGRLHYADSRAAFAQTFSRKLIRVGENAVQYAAVSHANPVP